MPVDRATAAELRRLARLFLLSALTLVLVVARAVVEALGLTPLLPPPLAVVWGLALLSGWAATCVYGVFVTFSARRWPWLVLCLFPLTSVPAAVAYAWLRRREVERAVLGDAGTGG